MIYFMVKIRILIASGKIEQTTAFKPINQPEGLPLSVKNIKAPIKISESTTLITPVTTIVK